MSFEHNPNLELPAQVLPHSGRSLYLDGAVSDDENGVRAFWNLESTSDSRLVPVRDVKMIEAIAQAGAYTIFRSSEEPLAPLFQGIAKAEYRALGLSGDQVELTASLSERTRKGFKGEGSATVDGRVLTSAQISGRIMSAEAFRRVIGGLDPVIDETELSHNDSLPTVETVFSSNHSQEIWLDGVTEADSTSAKGFWTPPAVEYEGHAFGAEIDADGRETAPGKEILPGIKQVGAIEDLTAFVLRGQFGRISGVENVSFIRPVLLGERLDLEVKVHTGTIIWRVEGVAQVAGIESCRATVLIDTLGD